MVQALSVAVAACLVVFAYGRAGREGLILEGHSEAVSSASFSPDGTKVVSASGSSFGSTDNTVRIWDAVTGECEQTLEGHSSGVMSASFSPDGTKVVSGSGDQTVRIWDAVLFVLD